MTSFIFLLILLLVWFFILAPFIKLINVSRQWNKTFGDAQKRAQQRQASQRKHEKQNKRKKKIDPNIGEYVEFTETTVNNTNSTTADKNAKSTTGNSAATESQITDVSWVDIPDKPHN